MGHQRADYGVLGENPQPLSRECLHNSRCRMPLARMFSRHLPDVPGNAACGVCDGCGHSTITKPIWRNERRIAGAYSCPACHRAFLPFRASRKGSNSLGNTITHFMPRLHQPSRTLPVLSGPQGSWPRSVKDTRPCGVVHRGANERRETD